MHRESACFSCLIKLIDLDHHQRPGKLGGDIKCFTSIPHVLEPACKEDVMGRTNRSSHKNRRSRVRSFAVTALTPSKDSKVYFELLSSSLAASSLFLAGVYLNLICADTNRSRIIHTRSSGEFVAHLRNPSAKCSLSVITSSLPRSCDNAVPQDGREVDIDFAQTRGSRHVAAFVFQPEQCPSASASPPQVSHPKKSHHHNRHHGHKRSHHHQSRHKSPDHGHHSEHKSSRHQDAALAPSPSATVTAPAASIAKPVVKEASPPAESPAESPDLSPAFSPLQSLPSSREFPVAPSQSLTPLSQPPEEPSPSDLFLRPRPGQDGTSSPSPSLTEAPAVPPPLVETPEESPQLSPSDSQSQAPTEAFLPQSPDQEVPVSPPSSSSSPSLSPTTGVADTTPAPPPLDRAYEDTNPSPAPSTNPSPPSAATPNYVVLVLPPSVSQRSHSPPAPPQEQPEIFAPDLSPSSPPRSSQEPDPDVLPPASPQEPDPNSTISPPPQILSPFPIPSPWAYSPSQCQCP
ncbi:pollen-specific leucine-rich repeat extensin-like protein 3 [Selaginella moellendorffii]|uniref:pollen-specific leucine-rich repeat extensin-like protein 3 n=1 Tax=Selaginella moellendorffii TaxID=88036 RepID=UPI000D1D09D7|nr:pollen-specific leucine-rich repeat extensin-like protein 3 [Selaginella moellendorffii]|eukprot:XP_024537208.1 pollen-specific leucine-rich repeat extensin-like protein 3 [Selaginella moellendorffii]